MGKLSNRNSDAAPAAGSHFESFAAFPIDNPYPSYDRLRSAEPVYWDPVLNTWVLTGYDDVAAALGDHALEPLRLDERVASFGERIGKRYSALERSLRAVLFFKSGEAHKQGRRLLARVFGRIPLTELEPVIESFASSLVEKLAATEEFDAIHDFAMILPSRVMARIVDIPDPDGLRILTEFSDFTRTLDISSASLYESLDRNSALVHDRIARLVKSAVAERRDSPLALIYEEAPFEGEAKLMEAAALATFAFLVGAETTMSLIGSCILALLRQPALYDRARQEPSLAADIVAEVVRLESPVQRTIRVARAERIIGGKRIRAGDLVLLLLGAANRDPAAYADAAALRLGRRRTDNVAFGGGQHVCLGMGLARLEGRIAVEKFLQLPPVVQGDGRETWQPARTVRRLKSLPVRFTAAR